MQETKEFIAADGAKVQVEVNSAEGNKAAVLMVHGFTGDVNEHIFYNAAQSWPKKGLDVWRISLYPGEPAGTRLMTHVTWQQNLSDIALVLKEMGQRYESLFLAGHSMGGVLATYSSHPKIKAKALWDPALGFQPSDFAAEALNANYHTIHWGCAILVSKKYSEECFEASRYLAEIPIQPPILVVRATDFFGGWPKARIAARVVLIKDSDHCFNKEGNEKKLFSLTLNFFKKHMGAQLGVA